jgi:hypothetical protein
MNPLRYLQIAFVLLLLGAGGYGVWSYRHMAEQAATADSRVDAAEANVAAANRQLAELQSRLDTLSKEAIRRTEFDAHVRSERAEVSRNLDTASREDPTAAGYLSQPIPQRVRDAFVSQAAAPAQR